eukprot:gene11263-18889_t
MKFVIASIPLHGITEPAYGGGGALGELMKYGVAQAINLDAYQARIVLLLALAEKPSLSINKLQGMYNDTTPMTYQSGERKDDNADSVIIERVFIIHSQQVPDSYESKPQG